MATVADGLWAPPAGTTDGESTVPIDRNALLRKALRRAGEELGLSAQLTAEAVGRSRSFFDKGREKGPIDAHTTKMIALLLRLHRGLSALVGDEVGLMRHWFHTPNHHTGGIPAEQVQDPEELVAIVQYLDAMRGQT